MTLSDRTVNIGQIVGIVFLTVLGSVTLTGAHLNPIVVNNISVGQSPQGVGVNAVTNRVYVASGDTDTVSVIDGTTEGVIATIDVGNQPVGVAVNDITNQIYVANYSGDTVSVIDGLENVVTATIPVGSRPIGVGVNRESNRVYVSNLSSNTVSVIDGASDTVVATIPVGQAPYGVGVNPATNRVYVANFTSGSLSVIDASNTVITTISDLVVWPTGVGVNPLTDRIYVSSWILNAPVKVIDGATNTVTATIVPGRNRALGVTVNPSNNFVYVAYRWGGGAGGSLVSIDGTTNSVTSDLFLCCLGAPLYVDVNPLTDRVYVSLPGYSNDPADAHWVSVIADGPCDLTPPTLNLSLTPGLLAPPDRTMNTVTATIAVSDDCDPTPRVTLVSIVASGPDSLNPPQGPFAGPDIQDAHLGIDDREFQLRAELNGDGTDRVYTVTYEAQDNSGKTTTRSRSVVVTVAQRP